jgi:hypothetical protein
MSQSRGARFVVTGCARSGTTYTARLLSKAGCSCTHESVFGPRTEHFTGWGAAQGDSSWLAVPFLDELPAGTVVLHQVREPFAAIDALVRFQLFSTARSGMRQDARALARSLRGGGPRALLRGIDPRRRISRGVRLRSDFVAFLRKHCPEAFVETSDAARAARHWVAWNTRIEATATGVGLRYLRVQIESVDEAMLSSIVDLLGGEADHDTVLTALETVPTDANRQPGGRSAAIERADLGDDLASELEATAERYGYAIRVT